MSRSLSPKLSDIRRRVLEEGTPRYCVTINGGIFGRAENWFLANELARDSAYKDPGNIYVAQERRFLHTSSGMIVAVKRARSWASYGVVSMEECEE